MPWTPAASAVLKRSQIMRIFDSVQDQKNGSSPFGCCFKKVFKFRILKCSNGQNDALMILSVRQRSSFVFGTRETTMLRLAAERFPESHRTSIPTGQRLCLCPVRFLKRPLPDDARLRNHLSSAPSWLISFLDRFDAPCAEFVQAVFCPLR